MVGFCWQAILNEQDNLDYSKENQMRTTTMKTITITINNKNNNNINENNKNYSEDWSSMKWGHLVLKTPGGVCSAPSRST